MADLGFPSITFGDFPIDIEAIQKLMEDSQVQKLMEEYIQNNPVSSSSPATPVDQPLTGSPNFEGVDWAEVINNIDLGAIDLTGANLGEGTNLAPISTVPSVSPAPATPTTSETSGTPEIPETVDAMPATTTPVDTTPATTTPVDTTPATTTPATTTPVDEYTESAWKILEDTLKYYGLGDTVAPGQTSLLDEVKKLWLNKTISAKGATVDDIGIQLRDTEAFKRRFPANKMLADAQKPQYSISSYLRLEADFKNRMKAAGLPEGFYDQPEDFQQLIGQEVSPDELQGRIDQGYLAVKNANPTVIAEFKRLYSVKDGDLAAYFIDPTRAKPTFDKYEAQKQARAAAVASQATLQANMELSTAEAESLVQAGITEESQAQQGFSNIQAQQQLFAGLGPEEKAVSREEQIAGTFGTNAATRQKIEKRRATRKAEFGAGGSLGETTKGVTGLTTIG